MNTEKKFGIFPNETDKIKHSIAGAVAGCVSSIVTCPLDVVKTRLQNQGKLDQNIPSYKGTGGIILLGISSILVFLSNLMILNDNWLKFIKFYLGTLRRIWAEEGIRGLYRGLGPTLYGYLPTWAIYFSAYDYFKAALAGNIHKTFFSITIQQKHYL